MFTLPGADVATAHQSRQGDIFQRRKRRQQVMKLKHETQGAAPQHGQRAVIQPVHLLALQTVTAGRHALEQADDVKQGAFTRARGTDQRNELPMLHLQRNPVEDLGLAGQAEVIALAHVPQVNKGAGIGGGDGGHDPTSGWLARGPAPQRAARVPQRPAPHTPWQSARPAGRSTVASRSQKEAARQSRARIS